MVSRVDVVWYRKEISKSCRAWDDVVYIIYISSVNAI